MKAKIFFSFALFMSFIATISAQQVQVESKSDKLLIEAPDLKNSVELVPVSAQLNSEQTILLNENSIIDAKALMEQIVFKQLHGEDATVLLMQLEAILGYIPPSIRMQEVNK